jgi:hypothetical protein
MKTSPGVPWAVDCRCACRHPDAFECMRIRHGQFAYSYDDEPCECRCHDEQEDECYA